MLTVKNLSYAYGPEKVLYDLNFQADEGESTCVLGANGSGKSTLLKCLNKVLTPDQGTIWIDNRQLTNLPQKEVAQQISMVPQEHSVVFSYRVLDLVVMGVTPYLSLGSAPDKSTYKEAEKILQRLGIENLAARKFNKLSGGEKQLVLIARALMQNTKFLVMDEPTSHLDFKNQYLLMQEITKLTNNGVGLITALHNPNLAFKFCDRIILIKEGTILAQGTTEEIMKADYLQEIYGLNVVVDEVSNSIEVVFSERAG